MPRYSKNAFNCYKCPGKGGDGGCPMFWDTVHTNTQTSEIKTIRSCGYEQLPTYLVEVIKASNRPAAAMESTRNEMMRGLAAIATVALSDHSLLGPPAPMNGITYEEKK